MSKLLLAFSLLLVAASCGEGASPLRRSPRASACAESGQYVCNEACDQLSLCAPNSQGGLDAMLLETCSAGSRCSAELHRCVDRPTACGAATGGGIACHDAGIFPDPFNCTLYHICTASEGVSTVAACDPGYAYNALTGDCSYGTTDSVCTDGPMPPCIREGQSGALADPSVYYVCTNSDDILTPSFYRCQNGQVYDPEVKSCVDQTW